MRTATGFTIGPDTPPVLFATANVFLLISIFIPVSVLIRDTASAPPASAALAISVISVTFGVSFIMIGCFAIFLICAVSFSTLCASWPNARNPALTFGQEILISIISIASSARRSTTARYSFGACPHTFTMIFVSKFFRYGISLSQNRSIPGF